MNHRKVTLTRLNVAGFIFFASDPLQAATEFAPEELLFVNNPMRYALASDYDGDGDRDLVIAGDAGLSVMRNLDGAGAFGTRQLIGTARSENDQLADLDGDGDLDILSVQLPGGSSRRIVWHRNEGGGAFAASITIRNENSQLAMLSPTDVDGDGDLDLIWYDGQSDVIEWMENTNGLGTFGSPQTITGLANIFLPILVDLNGDAVPDFVGRDTKGTGVSSDDELIWLPGQMSPALGFGAPQGLAAAGVSLLATGDVDGDADLDLIVAGTTFGVVEWLPNDGTGVFGVARAVATLPATPSNVSVVDVDGDNRADVLFYSVGDGTQWSRNTDGTGTFAAPAVLAPPATGSFRSVVAAELTGDSKTDLLQCEETDLTYLPQSPGGPAFGAPVTVATSVDDITDIASADIDGDGDRDILFSTADGKLLALTNGGTGNFGAASVLLTGQDALEVILPAQIDGLGGPDLVALRRDANVVSWHAGDGAGNFSGPMLIDNFGATPSAAAVADFNGDGSPDVAVAFAGDQNCAWYSQNPTTHAFAFHFLSGTVSFTRALAAGDIDGDLDADIVAGGFSDGNVYVYRNNGSGVFTAATLVGTASAGLDQLELADADGDGDLDVFAFESSGVESTITILFNDGAGAFPVMGNAFTGGSGLRSMALGDLDQDGDVDFVTANVSADAVLWHENDGAGNFTFEGLVNDDASSPYTVALADLDGDGDLDVLNMSRFAGLVGWFRNEFRPPPPNNDPVTVWAWALGVTAPDVIDLTSDTDGDGLTLLQEFAFHTDPLVADAVSVPVGGTAGTPELFFTFGASFRAQGTFIRRRDRAAIGLTYTIEAGPDMVQWSELLPGTAVNIDADYERVNVNRVVNAQPPRHFIRLRLTYAPPP